MPDTRMYSSPLFNVLVFIISCSVVAFVGLISDRSLSLKQSWLVRFFGHAPKPIAEKGKHKHFMKWRALLMLFGRVCNNSCHAERSKQNRKLFKPRPCFARCRHIQPGGERVHECVFVCLCVNVCVCVLVSAPLNNCFLSSHLCPNAVHRLQTTT